MPQTLPIRLRTIAAAVTVIASGLIIWNAYQYIIGSSDMDNATIPIISASTEPFRVVPDDPGGLDIPNKDSHLYNVLKLDHADDLALDGVFLPQDDGEVENLFEAEQPQKGFTLPEIAEAKTESLFGEIAQLKVKEEIAQDPDLSEMPEENREELKEFLGEAIIENEMEAAQEPVVEKLMMAEVSRPEATKEITINENEVEARRVPRPMKKPMRATAATESGPREQQKEFSIDRLLNDKTATKRHYIQLASLRSEQDAKAAYQRIRDNFPDLVAGASVFYPQADLGSRGTFTRIQIGPFRGEEARKRCASYTAAARGGTCLVVSR